MLEKYKSFNVPCFSVFLTAPGHKNAHYLAALHLLIFSKLHRVPHVILHQIFYILLNQVHAGHVCVSTAEAINN